jgi:phosphoesterase RecJ-like protein
MKSLDELKELLKTNQSIVILPHTKPDADALGSCLALASVLKKNGHSVDVISPTDYPRFLNWIAGQKAVIRLDENSKERIESKISDANLIFCLDFCNLKRIDSVGPMVASSKAKKVLIDHHIGKEDFADFELWSTKASSTAELIYDFIYKMSFEEYLDKDISEAIYAGMMTDTGSFRFPATSKKVHLIIAELMDQHIDHSKIHRLIYDNNRIEKIKFLGYSLSEKLNYLKEYNTAYICLTQEELNRFDYRTGDSEGLVNYALSLKNVVFAALIIEKDGMVKFSFRSIGDFDVNEYAKKYFNGGGHKNAAGGRHDGSPQEAEQKFLDSLSNYKLELIKQLEIENSLC